MVIYITGTGRSGTSWFGDLIAINEGLPYFSEPFGALTRHDPFKLLKNKLVPTPTYPNKKYIMECISQAVKLIPNFVVKDFWALYYTKELQDNFDFKIINVIRSPASWFCSASNLDISIGFYDFIGNPTVMDAIRPYIDHIYSRNDYNWIAWMSWCIRYVTLRNSGVGSWVTHEELCLNPTRAFEKMGLKLNDKGRNYISRQNNNKDNNPHSKKRVTENEPFKYFGKFVKLEEMKKAMEPFGVLDWNYWDWDDRFCLKNIKN